MLAVKDPKYWYLNFTATSLLWGVESIYLLHPLWTVSSGILQQSIMLQPLMFSLSSMLGVWFVSSEEKFFFLSVFTCFRKFVWRQRRKEGILILEEASLFSSFQFLLDLLPLIRIALIDLRSNLIEIGHVPFWSNANGTF